MKTTDRLPVLALLLIGQLLACQASSVTPGPASFAPEAESSAESSTARIDSTTHHTLRAKHIDQVFSIDVWVPPGVPGPMPVVYMTDGNSTFAMAAQSVMPMMFGKDVPPVVVVGVGYEVDSPFEVVALRTRDFLPSYVEGFAERMAASGMPLPDGVRPGGADAFLAFLNEELKPFIEARYPVDPENTTLVGASYGGTFATHVLFSQPESFDRYIIGSPVLAWDAERLFRDEEAYAARTRALPVTLFLSVGALEIENGIREPAVRMMERLAGRGYEGLELTTHVFEDETHGSAIGPTISRGLRAVFGTWPAP